MDKPNVFFTEIFSQDKDVFDEYGALNISLINDMPLFIDPFLLFNSQKDEYKKLHNDIIKYLTFLKDESSIDDISNPSHIGKLKAWYLFQEVKQNWLGFSKSGNSGSGTGMGFAESLHNNLYSIFNSFGEKKINTVNHLEKLCIIDKKVGKDKISDFTTNIIKDYLLQYTEKYAKENINESMCKVVNINRAYFNYKTKTWVSKSYYLPYYNGDYIILTPKDILTRDNTFINKEDMYTQCYDIIQSVDDEELRFSLNNYLERCLSNSENTKPSKKEISQSVTSLINEYPEYLDYYIRYKEKNQEQATSSSFDNVEEIQMLLIENTKILSQKLTENNNVFYDSKTETIKRISFLKDVIENKDGYKLFYHKGEAIKKEADLQLLFKFVWYRPFFNVDSEVNNGRGPVDFKVSMGEHDSTLVEFKLASNSKLKQNLKHQVKIYEKANNTRQSIKVILYFSEKEYIRVKNILSELKLSQENGVVLINAIGDKQSASNVNN